MFRSYHWSIALRQLRNRPSSSLRLLLVIAFCTVLIATTASLWFYLYQQHTEHVDSATISLFLKPEVDAKSAYDLASDFMKDASLASIDVQTPDSLREYFQERYGVNVAEVLPQNPFTSVLRIHLKPEFLTNDATFLSMVQQYRTMNSIVEEVHYQSEYVRAVTREYNRLMWSALIGAGMLLIVCLLLISFAFRAESMYASDDQRVVLLLGAKRSFLARSSLWRILVCTVPALALGLACCYALLMMAQSSGLLSLGGFYLNVMGASALLCLLLVLLLHRRAIPSV